MKPLALHIYEKHPDADAYKVGGAYQPYCLLATEKRFSEAELAAEFWKAAESVAFITVKGGIPIRASRKLAAIERFNLLPHYDEADQ